MSGPWRFIAGARCPECGALDSLRMRRANGQIERDCVDCSFHDVQPSADALQSVDPRADSRLGGADLLEPGERALRIVEPRADEET